MSEFVVISKFLLSNFNILLMHVLLYFFIRLSSQIDTKIETESRLEVATILGGGKGATPQLIL